MILKGSYVEIMQKVLEPEERAKNIPEDTKLYPQCLWAKGWLLEDSEIGCRSLIKTINGRMLEGILTEVNPRYSHDFGESIQEIMYIGTQAKNILWGDEVE